MHEQFLLLALEQAKLGQGICAPNPCVGAIAVQNGLIIAQAWHKGAGTPHAEQLLLAQFPPKTPGVTVYITLEPCNHWGRTPPCVDALIQHGIDTVVFACADPNPLVANNGSCARLTEQGIKVLQIAVPEITAFYRSYTYWTRTGKPWVTVKIAHTLNGKIGGAKGERIQLSNAECSKFTQLKRAATDVILTSSRTVLLDNPKLNARLNNTEIAKTVAILDTHLSLHANLQIFSKAAHCLVYHHQDAKEKQAYPNSSFYKVPLKNAKLDLVAVIDHLGSLGFHDVWVEVGGMVFSALHKQGLVQTTYVSVVPTVLGEDAISAFQDTGIFQKKHSVFWQAMGDNAQACFEWQED